jgi:LEA14-like dessication related protein
MTTRMNRRAWCRQAGVLGTIWALAGCAGFGLREPLQVNLVGIDPLPGEGMEIRLAVKLRVQNPNDAALEFDGVWLALDVRGTSFATGVSAERGSVPRFGETLVTVPVSVSVLATMRQFIGMASSKEKQAADYALRGRLSGTGFGSVSFESKGEINLSNLLQIK